MATHSSIFAWRIPCTEEPGALQSTGLQRVRPDRDDLACTHSGHRLNRGEGHAWSRCPVLRFGRSSTSVSSALCPPALCHFPRLRQPPTTHPATPDHCPLALQPTCLDSSSSVRSGGRARLELGSSRHMEMAVERTRAVCPPTHTGHTSGGRRLCLCMHEAGAWAGGTTLTGLRLEKRMMDGKKAERRETDTGLQRLRWFHVHRSLCMGGAPGPLALMPESSECPPQEPRQHWTHCASAQSRF